MPAKSVILGEFRQVTGTSESTARKYLKANDYILENALNHYLNSSHASSSRTLQGVSPSCSNVHFASKSQLSVMFDKYRDPEEKDFITVEGTEALCNDLRIDPTKRESLVLAFCLGCENMCEFKRKNWLDGWQRLLDSTEPTLNSMAAALVRETDATFKNKAKLKALYIFAFGFGLQESQKSLSPEVADAFWKLLIAPETFSHIDEWRSFVLENHGKAISRDTWIQFFDFVDTSSDSFDDHDLDGAWPYLIDQFVVHHREKSK